MRRDFSTRAGLLLGPAIAMMAVACHGKDPNSATGGAGGAFTATTGTELDLEPICRAFCEAYAGCAPETNCKLGCMGSPVLACKKEYADDVECITANLVGCTPSDEACSDPRAAYQACIEQHPP